MFNFVEDIEITSSAAIEKLHLKVWKTSKQNIAIRQIIQNSNNLESSVLIGLNFEQRQKWTIPIHLIHILNLDILLKDIKTGKLVIKKSIHELSKEKVSGWFNQNSPFGFSCGKPVRDEYFEYSTFMVYPNVVSFNTFEIPFIESDAIKWRPLFTVDREGALEFLLNIALCLSTKENLRSCFFIKVREDFQGNILDLTLELPIYPTETYTVLEKFGLKKKES